MRARFVLALLVGAGVGLLGGRLPATGQQRTLPVRHNAVVLLELKTGKSWGPGDTNLNQFAPLISDQGEEYRSLTYAQSEKQLLPVLLGHGWVAFDSPQMLVVDKKQYALFVLGK